MAAGPTFKQAATAFSKEAEFATEGERSDRYMTQKEQQVRIHLIPFFGDKTLSEVTAGLVQSHRAWFSPEEYKRLYQASRERAKNPKKER